MNDSPANQPTGNLLAWLQLMRISALPTAASNILAGFLLANQTWTPASQLLLLIVSSCCLYISGMVLNDYCDFEVDKQNRSTRPLASGRIKRNQAVTLYSVLSLVGVVCSLLVGWKSMIIAGLLVIAIFMYNRVLKQTAAAPVMMGTCRSLNILLGASYAGELHSSLLDFPTTAIWVAIAIGCFICGLTWFARNEATQSTRINLYCASILMLAGVLALAGTGYVFSLAKPLQIAGLIVVVSIPAFYRVWTATVSLTATHVQQAVRSLIQSLIFFDAAVCIIAAPDTPIFAIVTAAMIIPAIFLGRFTSST